MGAPESGDMERDHAETVRKLVSPGRPSVEPRIAEVSSWLEDPNCTGCRVALEFLKSVGGALAPHVKRVLKDGPDDIRFQLLGVVETWPRQDRQQLSDELEALTMRRDDWGVDLRALELLVHFRLRDQEWLTRVVGNRIANLESDLDDLRALRAELEPGQH